jgi:hypothetical protein
LLPGAGIVQTGISCAPLPQTSATGAPRSPVARPLEFDTAIRSAPWPETGVTATPVSDHSPAESASLGPDSSKCGWVPSWRDIVRDTGIGYIVRVFFEFRVTHAIILLLSVAAFAFFRGVHVYMERNGSGPAGTLKDYEHKQALEVTAFIAAVLIFVIVGNLVRIYLKLSAKERWVTSDGREKWCWFCVYLVLLFIFACVTYNLAYERGLMVARGLNRQWEPWPPGSIYYPH